MKLQQIIDQLIHEHDEHMKSAYISFMAGEEVGLHWAYAAGLQHAIRSFQDAVDSKSQDLQRI